MKKRILSLLLALGMALSLSAPALAVDELPAGWTPADGARPAGSMIKPVENGNSTYIPGVEEAQSYVMDKGWMTGTDTGFAPELTVNRATVYEMLWKMEGKPQVTNKMATFPDAVGMWFETSARWAEQLGLTTGDENGNYNGERVITKAELVTILYRYTKDYLKLDVSQGEGWSLDVFEDAQEVQSWAQEAMTWAWISGVACQLDADSTIKPEAQVSRIELAKMLTVLGGELELQGSDAQEQEPAAGAEDSTEKETPADSAEKESSAGSTEKGTSSENLTGGAETEEKEPAAEETQTPAEGEQETAEPSDGESAADESQTPAEDDASEEEDAPTKGMSTGAAPAVNIAGRLGTVRGSSSISVTNGKVNAGSTVTINNFSPSAGLWIALVCNTAPTYEGVAFDTEAQSIAMSPNNVIADTNISHLQGAFPVKVYKLKSSAKPAAAGAHTFNFPGDFDLIRDTGALTVEAVQRSAAAQGVEVSGTVWYAAMASMANTYGYLGSFALGEL